MMHELRIGDVTLAHRGTRCGLSCVLRRLFGFIFILLPGLAHAQKAPAKVYVYLEPFSARVECLIRLVDALPLFGEKVIPLLTAEDQERVKAAANAKAAEWPRLKVDGLDDGKMNLANASIVLGEPGRTQPVKAGDSVPVSDAMIGLVWKRDLPGIFEAITLEWTGFGPDGLSSLPVSVIAAGGVEEFLLSPSSRTFGWKNRGRVSVSSPLTEVPSVPVVEKFYIPLGSILWIVFGTGFLMMHMRRGRRVPGRVITTLMSILLGAAIFWPVLNIPVSTPGSASKPIEPERAEKILSALLRNIYKSFDRQNESEIYDVLARSVQGDLLQKLYLQIISALTLDEQEGTRVKLDETPDVVNPAVQVDGIKMLQLKYGFVADVRWMVIGTVGHWGHQHQRVNRYKAKVTVEPTSSDSSAKASTSREWKITAIEVEKEDRM